jgi:hypothetical protein
MRWLSKKEPLGPDICCKGSRRGANSSMFTSQTNPRSSTRATAIPATLRETKKQPMKVAMLLKGDL